MKKSEILSICRENNVHSSNLYSFSKRRKSYNSLDCKKVRRWLDEDDKLQELKKLKEIDKGNAKSFNMSYSKYKQLKEFVLDKLKNHDTGYSMGEEFVCKVNGKNFVSLDNREEYANSCKWKATHGYAEIDVTKADLNRWINGEIILRGKGTKHNFQFEFISK